MKIVKSVTKEEVKVTLLPGCSAGKYSETMHGLLG